MRLGDLTRGYVLALLITAPAAAQQSPLIGTWTSAMNLNTPGVIYVTLTILPNGQIQEKFMNRLGVAYVLAGTYEFDAKTGTLRYQFSDWSPKQLCAPTGTCQTFTPPPGQLGKQPAVQLTFPNPNLMLSKSADGATATWGRGA
jgi:hypothetical protein